jgi:hypothetical protein
MSHSNPLIYTPMFLESKITSEDSRVHLSGDKYTKETKNFHKNDKEFITVIISCQSTTELINYLEKLCQFYIQKKVRVKFIILENLNKKKYSLIFPMDDNFEIITINQEFCFKNDIEKAANIAQSYGSHIKYNLQIEVIDILIKKKESILAILQFYKMDTTLMKKLFSSLQQDYKKIKTTIQTPKQWSQYLHSIDFGGLENEYNYKTILYYFDPKLQDSSDVVDMLSDFKPKGLNGKTFKNSVLRLLCKLHFLVSPKQKLINCSETVCNIVKNICQHPNCRKVIHISNLEHDNGILNQVIKNSNKNLSVALQISDTAEFHTQKIIYDNHISVISTNEIEKITNPCLNMFINNKNQYKHKQTYNAWSKCRKKQEQPSDKAHSNYIK